MTRLNNGEYLTINILAEEYATHARTIKRDFERLESCNLPLQKNGQQYFLDQSYLGKLNFNDIRTFARISGIKHLYPDLDTGFIRELLNCRSSAVYDAKGYFFEDASRFKKLFEIFGEAIKTQKQIAFIYKDESRVVEPYKLIHHHGCWYLAAVRKGELRAYRLSRISLSYEHHNLANFQPDANILKQLENEESIWFGQEKFEVILTVQAEVALHFRQRQLFPEQQIVKELDDGSLLLSSRITHTTQLLPLVRYWIPFVRIVNPVGMQEELEEGVKEYLGLIKEC
ncbi:helix-turn-helix transcriptional regulator [Acinetobacter puyangensis]|uniref:helix-turn-helix transcriptional regulator n=1 Tax=Acinetobacter puyangensis TaxID=1096779 RepID=UPI003A4D701A